MGRLFARSEIEVKASTLSVKVVRSLEELQQVVTIRAIVYIEGQDCPYEEEFDGNDLCAMHLIAYVGREASACLRIRFFGDFAKLERLAVRPSRRQSAVAFAIVRDAIGIVRRKGFTRVYGHARVGLEPFWARFGARPVSPTGAFTFSGHRYTEMMLELPKCENAIGLLSDPLLTIRPEGDWDRPGVLEGRRR